MSRTLLTIIPVTPSSEDIHTAQTLSEVIRHVITNLTPPPGYRLAEEARLVELPAAPGDSLSLQPSLVHPVLERPLAYVDGLPIAQILSVCAGTGGAVHDILQSLSTSPLRQKYAAAIRWLIGMGIVIPAESSSARQCYGVGYDRRFSQQLCR